MLPRCARWYYPRLLSGGCLAQNAAIRGFLTLRVYFSGVSIPEFSHETNFSTKTLGQSLQNMAQVVKNEDTPEKGDKSCE